MTVPEPHVTLDPATLPPAQRKLQPALEEQLTSALQAAADRVAADYAGEPVAHVAQRLLEEAKAGLHPDIAAGWEPDGGELAAVAEAIVRGATPDP
ncbi:MAG TPA: hypothetical protein VES42_28125 [Pilimelia sp.]|nr:hypothetical protein [Pilimelia sp.]